MASGVSSACFRAVGAGILKIVDISIRYAIGKKVSKNLGFFFFFLAKKYGKIVVVVLLDPKGSFRGAFEATLNFLAP